MKQSFQSILIICSENLAFPRQTSCLKFFCVLSYSDMNSKSTIEVKKASNESNMTLIRRFSRRVQEAGIVRTVKGQRYNKRAPSKLDRKTSALNRLKRGKEVERLKKL